MRHSPRRRSRGRWAIAAALSLFAVLAVGGCGYPAGVDGDLTDGWATIGAPTGFTPAAQTCHLANFSTAGARATYEVVGCKLKHRTETVYVGTYPSPAADADEPPAPGSAAARAAYQTCDRKTTEYVGAPWRNARLWVGVTQPTAAAWAAAPAGSAARCWSAARSRTTAGWCSGSARCATRSRTRSPRCC
nr:hypothetical protein GCM10020092_006460 [Actinoplanes digitatis]